MPDLNGYPTEEELKHFDRWKLSNQNLIEGFNPVEIVDYVESIWWAPDWGLRLKWGRDRIMKTKVMRLQLHTGGWSGNEDIISKLEQTFFWFMYWDKSERGGHYYFEIPLKAWKEKRLAG